MCRVKEKVTTDCGESSSLMCKAEWPWLEDIHELYMPQPKVQPIVIESFTTISLESHSTFLSLTCDTLSVNVCVKEQL